MAAPGDIKADPNDRPGAVRGKNGAGKKGNGKKGTGRWLLHFFILLMLFLASGVGLVWYLMDGDFAAPDTGDAPLILADKDPFKVRPQDPGGMNVPGRDRLVYDRLEEGAAAPAPEALLPPPEEPLPPPTGGEEMVAEFKPAAPAPAQPAPEAALAPVPSASAPAPVMEAPTPPPVAPSAPEPEEPEPATLAPDPTPVAPPVPAPAQAAPEGSYLVQMASLRSADAVEREWARLKKAHPDVLGRLTLFTQRIDLGPGKGVFYRLRAGALPEAEARAVCAALKTRKVGCLPVRDGN